MSLRRDKMKCIVCNQVKDLDKEGICEDCYQFKQCPNCHMPEVGDSGVCQYCGHDTYNK